ncbi:MAG: hypothetical protein JNL78_05005 [Rhodocyclaceae bacterium]|jgi:hypothetical protein|nr:hypothetical protein [Rhodocyclaceae bacterium]
MSEKTQRPHAQTAEDKQAKHYAADWWIYLVLALFIGGLVFLTYAVILRGDAMSNVGKSGSPTAPPASAAPAPPRAEKK